MSKVFGSVDKPVSQKSHKKNQLAPPKDTDQSNVVASSSDNSIHSECIPMNPHVVVNPTVQNHVHNLSMTQLAENNEANVPGDPMHRYGTDVVKSPEIRSPVCRISQEYPVSCISLMQSPPMQVMEKPEDYDPSRIPSSAFSRQSLEWSVASNDSLFSIRIGNNGSSRDYNVTTDVGELVKNGEEVYRTVNFREGDFKGSGIETRNPQSQLAIKELEAHQNLNVVKTADDSLVCVEKRKRTVVPLETIPIVNNQTITSVEIPSSSSTDSYSNKSENTALASSLIKKNKKTCCLWKKSLCCPSCNCHCGLDSYQGGKCFKLPGNCLSCEWLPGKCLSFKCFQCSINCSSCKCFQCPVNCSSCKCFICPTNCSSCKCFDFPVNCSSCKLSCCSSCDWSCCSCNCFSTKKLCLPSCTFKWCRNCCSCECCSTKWLNCKWFYAILPSGLCCCIKKPSCQWKPALFKSCC